MKMLPLMLCVLLCCGDSAPTNKSSSAPTANRQTPSSAKDAKSKGEAQPPKELRVVLDDEPSMSLVDNRYLWHLGSVGELLIPLASEGIRKYTHEYSRPWAGNLRIDGTLGRVLSSRQAVLRFGWFDEPGAALVRMRVHGLSAGQRVSIELNGKSIKSNGLEASWQLLEVEVPDGILRRGENQIKLHLGKSAKVGGTSSYGLWHSLSITLAKHEGQALDLQTTELQPAGDVGEAGRSQPALHGFGRLIHLVEIPESAYLDLETGGTGHFELRLVDDKGATNTLLSHDQNQEDYQHHQLSLADYAGQLVRLELHAPAAAAWGSPRIAMAPAKVSAKPAPAKNLILIVVDALRSDHVPLYAPVYGASQAQMPNVEKQAALGSAVFLNNQAASPSSPPSHGSIQTGMIPRVHGVDGDGGKILPGTPTVSTQVEKAGIASGFFGNNPFGMGRLKEPGGWTEFHQPGQEGKSNDCSALVDMMLEFGKKERDAGKRFFISSLPYETHTPYRYHQGISENYYDGEWGPPLGQLVNGDIFGGLISGSMKLSDQQWKQFKALYKGEAQYWDQCFGSLVKGLEDASLLQDTILVMTSDHGEGMFEHGHLGHAWGHNRELGDVPLVIFWPALTKGIRDIWTVTTHRDIVPTILDMLGVAIDPKVQGESLVPMVLREGPWLARVVSLEYGRSYSLRSQRYKLIADYNGAQEIFDLGTDPWEAHDIQEGGSDAVRYLRDMAGFFLEYRSQWHYLDWGTLNRQRAGLLKAAQARESAP